jgi:hypothetical protein
MLTIVEEVNLLTGVMPFELWPIGEGSGKLKKNCLIFRTAEQLHNLSLHVNTDI